MVEGVEGQYLYGPLVMVVVTEIIVHVMVTTIHRTQYLLGL